MMRTLLSALTPGEKKFFLIAGSVAVITAIVIGVTTWLLVRNHTPSDPTIAVSAGGDYRTIEPSQFCTLTVTDCRTGTPGKFGPKMPTRVGDSVILSVSREIWRAPWAVVAQYIRPDGSFSEVETRSAPESTYTKVFRSTKELTLLHLEVKLPSARFEGPNQDQNVTRAYWAVDTTPEGLVLPKG